MMNPNDILSRRSFLKRTGMGLGMVGLGAFVGPRAGAAQASDHGSYRQKSLNLPKKIESPTVSFVLHPGPLLSPALCGAQSD